jgi:hypothetical protein
VILADASKFPEQSEADWSAETGFDQSEAGAPQRHAPIAQDGSNPFPAFTVAETSFDSDEFAAVDCED